MAWIVGSQPPAGYVDWDEWADAQIAGGLTQVFCENCRKWLFPQEKHAAHEQADKGKPNV